MKILLLIIPLVLIGCQKEEPPCLKHQNDELKYIQCIQEWRHDNGIDPLEEAKK
jgi:hypothetical protein